MSDRSRSRDRDGWVGWLCMQNAALHNYASCTQSRPTDASAGHTESGGIAQDREKESATTASAPAAGAATAGGAAGTAAGGETATAAVTAAAAAAVLPSRGPRPRRWPLWKPKQRPYGQRKASGELVAVRSTRRLGSVPTLFHLSSPAPLPLLPCSRLAELEAAMVEEEVALRVAAAVEARVAEVLASAEVQGTLVARLAEQRRVLAAEVEAELAEDARRAEEEAARARAAIEAQRAELQQLEVLRQQKASVELGRGRAAGFVSHSPQEALTVFPLTWPRPPWASECRRRRRGCGRGRRRPRRRSAASRSCSARCRRRRPGMGMPHDASFARALCLVKSSDLLSCCWTVQAERGGGAREAAAAGGGAGGWSRRPAKILIQTRVNIPSPFLSPLLSASLPV